jgi:nucleoside-diphosphate-sugar epimerase
MAAAKQAGARRLVAQSFCGWPYAREGGPVKSEDDPLDPDPPRELRRTLEAIRYLEHAVTTASELDGVVLRYGAFYGHNTGLLDGPLVDQLRRRRVPLIGDANGWWSFLHIDDAAAATAIAVERASPGIYNISMTSQRRCASGCPGSRLCWARNRPGASRNGSPASPRESTS